MRPTGKFGDRTIICARERASMASTWNEYLCVANIARGVGRIDVCQFEPLGEYEKEDEDGNERPIPQVVGGKTVVGIEDGYLVGGELNCCDDRQKIYTADEVDGVIDGLRELSFDVSEEMISEIRAAAV